MTTAQATPATTAAAAGTATPPAKRPSIFDLGNELQAMYDLLTELGGDITGNEETILKWQDEIDINVDAKLDGCGLLIRKLLTEAAAADEEAERYKKRSEVRKNAAERIKVLVKGLLEKANQKKRDTGKYTFAVAGNGGKQPLEVVLADLPEQYVDFVPVALDDKIRATLAEDEEYIDEATGEKKTRKKSIKGVTVKPRGTHLRIS